jgi:hypothetical protein
MATESAIGRRKLIAIQRIQERAAALSGGRELNLPRYNRHGAGMLAVVQLETLAEFLEQIPLPKLASPYAKMSFEQLKAEAKKRGGLAGRLNSKALLIQALEAADTLAAQKETEHA